MKQESKVPFIFTSTGGIGRLTLDRPATYNAFDHEMVEAFETFLRERRYDEETRVIVLDGGDAKGFCPGLEAALNMEDRNQIMMSYTYRMN